MKQKTTKELKAQFKAERERYYRAHGHTSAWLAKIEMNDIARELKRRGEPIDLKDNELINPFEPI